ncbi:unnamed protein product, partial [Brassica rapa subsp. narinosa]
LITSSLICTIGFGLLQDSYFFLLFNSFSTNSSSRLFETRLDPA